MHCKYYLLIDVASVFLAQTIYSYLYWFSSVYPVFSFWSKVCCCVCDAGVLQVSGMRVYTSGEVEAVNGTDARLKCTFQSSSPINPSTITVSWTFRPLGPGQEESVSVCVCVRVCVRVCKWERSNHEPHLTVSESVHPHRQVREESMSHQTHWGASKTDCVCVCICVWERERESERELTKQQFVIMPSELPSFPRSISFSLVWMTFCISNNCNPSSLLTNSTMKLLR